MLYWVINMVYSYEEIKKKLGSDYKLKQSLKKKWIFKIISGVYSDREIVDFMVVVCKKFPKAIITMDSAFYYHELTDVVPNKIDVATGSHAYIIDDDNISQYFINDDYLNIGRKEVYIEDNLIPIYDKERMLIELIKRSKQIPFDYYKEIINSYRSISNELDVSLLEEYCYKMKCENKVLEVIQKEVF